MTHTQAGTPPRSGAVDFSLMMKVFYTFATLAIVSLAVSVGGKALGRSVILGGHTEARTPRHILVAGDALTVPANMIRQEAARHDGTATRLDLYLRWPDLDGYTAAARDDFNHAGGRRNILFLSLQARSMSQDMSGRLEPIYNQIVRRPGKAAEAGLVVFEFKEGYGYANETLLVAARPQRPGTPPFVARCLVGPSAANSLSACERDIHIGRSLSLTYRFPAELLPQWRELDAAVRAKAEDFLGDRRNRPGT